MQLNSKVACLTLSFIFSASPLPAIAKNRLSPAVRKDIKKNNVSFRSCRRKALRLMQEGKLSPNRLKARLTGCQERYPGASLYINCKKKALKAYRSDKAALIKGIRDCKKLLVGVSFDPSREIPFYLKSNRQFFAGIGFNRPLSARELDLPNFDCQQLRSLAKEPAKAEYFLFGNEPKLFPGFKGLGHNQIRALFRVPARLPPDGHLVAQFGKIFKGPIDKKPITVYFPSGSCTFNGNPGENFTGLSTYYLIDQTRKRFIPYFAIAFYHPDFKASDTKDLSFKMLAMLNQSSPASGGRAFRAFSRKENMTLIATQKIQEFDEEGDPMNLCRSPRPHRFLAVVKGRSDRPEQPEYIILASIKNLCAFGDMVSRQFNPS